MGGDTYNGESSLGRRAESRRRRVTSASGKRVHRSLKISAALCPPPTTTKCGRPTALDV